MVLRVEKNETQKIGVQWWLQLLTKIFHQISQRWLNAKTESSGNLSFNFIIWLANLRHHEITVQTSQFSYHHSFATINCFQFSFNFITIAQNLIKQWIMGSRIVLFIFLKVLNIYFPWAASSEARFLIKTFSHSLACTCLRSSMHFPYIARESYLWHYQLA